jgi:aldehyde:ferredoxin oxidoreductase
VKYISDKILRIDLNSECVREEFIPETVLRKFIGGCALGSKILYDEVPPRINWDDHRNRLIFLGGQLSGTKIPGSGGFNVSTKGAMTNGAASTQAQGVFGAYLRTCGFLGMVIHGRATNWRILVIHEDGSAELKDAGRFVGMDTWQTYDTIADSSEFSGKKISCLSIGLGGENLVRFACICVDKGHTAAHNGVGAVMGSKKLKAIVVVRSNDEIPVKNKKRVIEISKSILQPLIDNKSSYFYYGTIPAFHRNNEIGNLPVKNYKLSKWEIPEKKFGRFTGEYIVSRYSPKRKRPCWSCPNRHSTVLTIPQGPYRGMEVEEPDYEQLAALGSNLGIEDLDEVLFLSNFVDRMGLDVNETGWALSFLIECYERGIISSAGTGGVELRWGNSEAIKRIIKMTADRESVGKVIADGVMRAVTKIGKNSDKIGIYTSQGTTPRSHDHRARWTELFDHCVSESGALDNTPIGPNIENYGISGGVQPRTFNPEEVVEMEVMMKGGMQLEDSAVTCRFHTRMDIELLVEAFRAVTGWDFSKEEAMKVGRRAVNIMRAFNIRTGNFERPNRPSTRYALPPNEGPGANKFFLLHYDKMLKNYYRGMGWDEKGRPLPETLKELGIERIIRDLES